MNQKYGLGEINIFKLLNKFNYRIKKHKFNV